jgi:hypothetical protein
MKIRPGLDPMLTDWNKPFLPVLGRYNFFISAGSDYPPICYPLVPVTIIFILKIYCNIL